MERQGDIAKRWVRRRSGEAQKILEVGCGTGWLANLLSPFGTVVAVDLSEQAISVASRNYPHIKFIAGEFRSVEFDDKFDFIVSADVIAHVVDHEAYVDRIAKLLEPGGIFLLMTQNAYVWKRSSYLMPKGKGQIREWPSLSRLKKLLRPKFGLVYISSIAPGGDRGLLWFVNHLIVQKSVQAVMGTEGARTLYERARIGRELIIVARRR